MAVVTVDVSGDGDDVDINHDNSMAFVTVGDVTLELSDAQFERLCIELAQYVPQADEPAPAPARAKKASGR